MPEAGPAQVVVATRTIVIFVAVTLGAALLVLFTYAARAILIQLIVAIVLAMALEPLVRMLERRVARRGAAVGIAFGAALLAVAAFAYLLIPPLVDEITRFGQHVPALLQKLTSGDGKLGFLEHRFHVIEHARRWITVQGGGKLLARPVLHTVGGLLSTGAAAVAVAFLTLFLMLGGGSGSTESFRSCRRRAARGGAAPGVGSRMRSAATSPATSSSA